MFAITAMAPIPMMPLSARFVWFLWNYQISIGVVVHVEWANVRKCTREVVCRDLISGN